MLGYPGGLDAWIFIDFGSFLLIPIDFRVSWRFGCLGVLIIIFFFPLNCIDFPKVFIDFRAEGFPGFGNPIVEGAALSNQC